MKSEVKVLSPLPEYTFRRSDRAKRLSLKLYPNGLLEIVLPKRVSEAKGLAFLKSQRDWVEKQTKRLSQSLAEQKPKCSCFDPYPSQVDSTKQ